MRGPPSAQESQQLEELMLAVEELRRRVAALERAAVPTASGAAADMSGPVSTFVAAPLPSVSSGLVPAVGRLLLGIAGAYLLRAIAEARVLPGLAGTTLGLIYAGAWLVWSVRIPRGRRLSAAFEAITASCIIAPLLWEATVRFHTLSTGASAAVLSLFVILGQMVARRRDHSALAGITALAGSATAIALIAATSDPMPFTIALAAAAAVIEYGAFRNGRAIAWRWIIAVTVDFCVFLLVFLAGRPQGLPEGYAPIPTGGLIALLIGLAVIYLSSTAARTVFHGLPLVWFELLQVPAVVALAVGGALRISHGSGIALMLTGSACLALSAMCYAAAFVRFASSLSRNFQAYATFGLLLALTGGVLLLSPLSLEALWSTLAVTATLFASRRRGNTLVMHGAVYLLAAAADSGLLQYTAQALTESNRALHLTTGALLCSIAAALCYGLTLRFRKRKAGSWTDRAARAFLATVLCWTVAGLSAGILARFSFDAPFASTIHTALISALVILLAWAGPRWNLREMVWLVFPWMLFGAVKLVAEDFQQGRPATLFLSLFIYGGTLIALPHLLRRNEQ